MSENTEDKAVPEPGRSVSSTIGVPVPSIPPKEAGSASGAASDGVSGMTSVNAARPSFTDALGIGDAATIDAPGAMGASGAAVGIAGTASGPAANASADFPVSGVPAPKVSGEPGNVPAVGRVSRSTVGGRISGATAQGVDDGAPADVHTPASVKPSSSRSRRSTPRARRMNLSLTHVSAWSVAKVSFLLGIAGALIQILATTLVWLLLDAVGVFDQITQIVSSTGLDVSGLDLSSAFSLTTILSGVTIFSIVEIVLLTLLAVIGAALYNVVCSLVGGVHITLGDD